jgi:hypothetical protein
MPWRLCGARIAVKEMNSEDATVLRGAISTCLWAMISFADTENGGLTMENKVRLIDANALFPYGAVPFVENDGFATADKLYGIIKNAPTIDPESLRPKGRWEIHCRSTYDSWTQETDEEFYLECSECRRQVWDVDYMAVQNDDRQKLIEKYPYCHCGAKMEG